MQVLSAEGDGSFEKALDVYVLFVASTWDYLEDSTKLGQFEVRDNIEEPFRDWVVQNFYRLWRIELLDFFRNDMEDRLFAT